MDFIRPTSTPLLLKELRSAACYAELAVHSGTCDPNEIETRVFNRSYKKTGPEKRRGIFYKAMNGTVVQPRYLLKIESVFPGTRIRWWRDHPLAEILCNAALEQDGVLKAIGTCAANQERQLMWDENYVGMLSWERFRVEVPDSAETIAALVQIGSVESLLVLVGRMRLAQLRGARGHARYGVRMRHLANASDVRCALSTLVSRSRGTVRGARRISFVVAFLR
ncbi:hypothetical protein [Pseudoxanthomonas suwonensis]|uniref:hypothetical protein n=1 Tax=Pseudoxanthomonas suwonensis TaxID=314722 RepID=UPI00118472B4|nr:hypothetical protein [Pseudoxanthomonas suwonensis]